MSNEMIATILIGAVVVTVLLLAIETRSPRNQIAQRALPSTGALPARYPTTTKGRIMETMLKNLFDKFRMLIWLVLGLTLYALSFAISSDHPTFQTVAYKLGHVTTLAWVGYWISRHAVGRISEGSTPHDRIARGLVIVGVIIAGSLGL